MGRAKEAEETLKRVLAANPSSEPDLRLAGELTLNSNPKLALTYLSKADALRPSALELPISVLGPRARARAPKELAAGAQAVADRQGEEREREGRRRKNGRGER